MVVPVVLLAGFILFAWKLGYFDLEKPNALNAAAKRVESRPWFPPIFVLVYATLAAIAAPVSPLAYGAGAIFGVLEGTIAVWIASMIGGTAGYVLARGAWSESARRLLGRHEDKLRRLRDGNPFLTTLRFQLMPVVPFGLFNYAAGTSGVPFLAYLAGTAAAIVPNTIAAVYVGAELRAGVRGSDRGAFIVAGAVAAAMFGLSFLPNLVAKWRRS